MSQPLSDAALNQLFQGFRANLVSLVSIGIFFVAGITLAVFASSLVDGGKLLDLLSGRGEMTDQEVVTALSDGALQAGMLFSALLSIPVLIATWWAPALVVFFGLPGIHVSIGAPLMSWVALGWGEPVVPWWGRAGFVGRPWWGGWGGPRVVNNVVHRRFECKLRIVVGQCIKLLGT